MVLTLILRTVLNEAEAAGFDLEEDPETALSRLRRAARALRAEQGIKRIP